MFVTEWVHFAIKKNEKNDSSAIEKKDMGYIVSIHDTKSVQSQQKNTQKANLKNNNLIAVLHLNVTFGPSRSA